MERKIDSPSVNLLKSFKKKKQENIKKKKINKSSSLLFDKMISSLAFFNFLAYFRY
jgi:hypothetical protein